MGEVWANILHVVYGALVDASDFSWNIMEDTPHEDVGNVVFFHLLFDALLLQPCNPTCELFYFSRYSAVFFTC